MVSEEMVHGTDEHHNMTRSMQLIVPLLVEDKEIMEEVVHVILVIRYMESLRTWLMAAGITLTYSTVAVVQIGSYHQIIGTRIRAVIS